jgi:hypothetical protein
MKPYDALLAVFLPFSALAAAPTVGYAQATGYFKKDSHPALYQPLNLLDGRDSTAWCSSGPDPLNDRLQFGFKEVVKIDEVRVYTGNGADDAAFRQFSRAKRFSFKSANVARAFTVADQRGLQAVTLDPPLSGATFSLEVLDQYPAENPDSPVCVTDIIFYSAGKPLNGSWLTSKLKYDHARAQFLGTWYSGFEGAPERFLSFFFDGTYRLVHEPLDGTKASRTLAGQYEASLGHVALEIPHDGKQTAKLVKDQNSRRALSFRGTELPEDLRAPFRDAP